MLKVLDLAIKYIETNNVKDLQRYLYKAGSHIAIDGILGKRTISAMMDRNYHLLEEYLSILTEQPISLKSKILDYLASAEGKHLHWNKTESGFTTMYGVYSKKHKKSKPIQFIRRRARELGFRSITRYNIHRVDRALTPEDKTILTDLIYQFYVKEMFIKDIIGLISDETYITYFSLAVHGGKPRGVKALKSAISIPLTKTWSSYNTDTLRSRIYNGAITDLGINNGMLDYMQSFYDYLIRTNPDKYAIYENGWNNRLRRLRRYR